MLLTLAVAGAAALASVLGGLLALARPPTSLTMSLAFGLASGVLVGAIALEMVPQALELASLAAVTAGFGGGFLLVWLFDLYVNRWRMAGEHAAQRTRVERYHRRHRPRGDEVTVLAGGTSAEELIEGLAIGTGVVVDPSVGLLVAAAIAVDNFGEGLSIGELAAAGRDGARRTVRWTSLIGVSLLGSAMVGSLLLRGADPALVGLLLAVGAGGMFYLTATALLPPAAERGYEGSGALAACAGFLVILVLAEGA